MSHHLLKAIGSSGITDIYGAQNISRQSVQWLVGLVFGQSRQAVNYSGFAQLLYVSQKLKWNTEHLLNKKKKKGGGVVGGGVGISKKLIFHLWFFS